ncbi:GAF domain-containing protein [Ramlibacter sp.]|uniref:pyridoxamine 5'-phosphate oxidase family protein n=1 Tax=Ramlibacter sp. TaxID=1917967 RepID=UPI0035B2B93A
MSTLPLPDDLLAAMARGVSVIVGSRDANGRPSVMRAVGSVVREGGAAITVFLARRQSARLIADLEATGHVAVVFSQPSTHRTLQLKARTVQLRPATADDEPALATYLASMEVEIQAVGLTSAIARAMLSHQLADLVAVSFTPEEAFDQTPGPRAGAPLAAGPVPPPPEPPANTLAPPAGAGPVRADQPLDPPLGAIRACFEGAIPAVMATCGADGVPNVAYISQVSYVDERHVALSFQFFNKTRRNILAHPVATTLMVDPLSGRFLRLHLRYLRTETQGPLFESMRAQLAGIASHSGMEGVFRLLGADVYAVEAVEAVPSELLPAPPPRTGLLGAVRGAAERLARCTSLEEALGATLAVLQEALHIRHAMVLMLDAAGGRLYTVASCGYPRSGVGSELRVGQGVIGVAAREATPVRIGHVTNAALYSQAIRTSFEAQIPDIEPVTEIPYPGLAEPHSQLAVPLLAAGRVLGVLFVESDEDLRFSFEDEDALVAIAGHLGAVIDLTQAAHEAAEAEALAAPGQPAAAEGAALQVRHYAANDSIFIGDTYLIKGVAGAILWKLLRDHEASGRTEFSNRELRLDAALKLPDVSDNLEARLLLLQRRLDEHGAGIAIERTGRGRFRLVLARPVVLQAT